MTDKELRRLRWLPKEIEELCRERDRARAALNAYIETDAVQGSLTDEPYTKHTITLFGLPNSSAARAAWNSWLAAAEKCREAAADYEALNSFIDSIPDRETRRIFILHYRKGLTWQQVARRMGWRDEGSPRKKIQNFLRNSENSDFGGL